ncbi:hypothetical protein D3C77_775170 [compost metagenome]
MIIHEVKAILRGIAKPTKRQAKLTGVASVPITTARNSNPFLCNGISKPRTSRDLIEASPSNGVR